MHAPFGPGTPMPEDHRTPHPPCRDTATIRRARATDIPSTARAHLQLLPAGLFPQLGIRFLRCWHTTFLAREHAVALVAVDQHDRVVAFLLGSTDQQAHTRDLVSDRRTLTILAFTGGSALLRRPRLAVRFLRTRALPWCAALLALCRGAGPTAHLPVCSRSRLRGGSAAGSVAVLTAVAVDPAWRGDGVGARLVEQFESHAAHHGAAAAELVTGTGVGGAAKFYERLGWHPVRELITRDGDSVRIYRRILGHRPFRALPRSTSRGQRTPDR